MQWSVLAVAVCAIVIWAAGGPVRETGQIGGEDIVIDDESPLFEVVDGKWNRSTRDAGFEGSGYLWCRGSEAWPAGPGRTSGLELVRWRFEPPTDGRYDVYAKWAASKPEDRATDAPYAIMHRDGQTVVRVNMADLNLSGKWNLLGTFDFERGEKAQVILNTNANNSVVADAVRFERRGEAAAAAPAWREETIAVRADEGKVVFAEDFSGGLERWVFEGPAEVGIREGKLRVKPLPMPGNMAWIKTKAPAEFRLEFDVTPLSESGFWLVFFCADALGGDMFDAGVPAREGVFQKYTDSESFRCYHTSYRRNLAGDCNLRKNPGMALLKSTPDLGTLATGKTHRVSLTYSQGRITLTVDGRTFVDYTDAENPYGEGYIGLRNVYDCETLYDNVVLYDLEGR